MNILAPKFINKSIYLKKKTTCIFSQYAICQVSVSIWYSPFPWFFLVAKTTWYNFPQQPCFRVAYLYLFIWKAKWKREIEIFYLLVLSPNSLDEPGMGQSGARSQEIHPGLMHGWQCSRYSGQLQLPFQTHRHGTGSETIQDPGVTSTTLTHCTTNTVQGFTQQNALRVHLYVRMTLQSNNIHWIKQPHFCLFTRLSLDIQLVSLP